MGQLSWDEVGYAQTLCYGFTLGSDPNIEEPYPQPYPSFSHGGCASQAYILKLFPRLRGEQFRYQTFDFGGSIKILMSRFMKGLDKESLEN